MYISAITVTNISDSFTYKTVVKITLVKQNYVTVTLCIYAVLRVKKEDRLDRVLYRISTTEKERQNSTVS